MNDILAIAGLIFASSGLWTFIQEVYRRHCTKKEDARLALVKNATSGLLYIGIQMSAQAILRRGYVTPQELHDIEKYMFEPYRALGGNGSAEAIIHKLEEVPFKEGDEK